MGEYADAYIDSMIDRCGWGYLPRRRRRAAPVPKHIARARCEAHAAFDHLWKEEGWDRSAAYEWLAEQMGLTLPNCHIALFDVEQCGRVVQICAMRDFAAL